MSTGTQTFEATMFTMRHVLKIHSGNQDPVTIVKSVLDHCKYVSVVSYDRIEVSGRGAGDITVLLQKHLGSITEVKEV